MTETTTAPLTGEFWVPEFLLPDLIERIGKLTRKAVKLGCKPVEFEVSGDKRQQEVGDHYSNGKRVIHYAEFVRIIVRGEAPKFNGWRLMARLIHPAESGLSENIVKSVPGEQLPQQYWTSDCHCEHCNTNRRRKDTFVVGNDAGETKQVGSDCLADFLGHVDPKLIAELASFYTEPMLDVGGSDDFGGDYSTGRWGVGVKRLLAYVATYTRLFGWVTKGQAQATDKACSATFVMDALTARTPADKELAEKVSAHSEDDLKEATAALEYVKGLNPTSDFEHNMKAIASGETVTYRFFNFACAIYGCYQRAMGKLAAAAAAPVSQHVGTIGEKITARLFVDVIRSIDGNYGVCNVHTMHDEQGNVFVWFCSGTPLKAGEWVNVKATVKGHDVYQNVPQTSLKLVKPV